MAEKRRKGSCQPLGGRITRRSDRTKAALKSRLSRIEGQVRGIRTMVLNDVYCDDVLNQIAAVQSALGAVSRIVLEQHMQECLIHRIQAGELEVTGELLATLKKLMR